MLKFSAPSADKKVFFAASPSTMRLRARAGLDPPGLVSELPARAILDELQRLPALIAALKLDAGRRRLPGRLLFLVPAPYFPHQFVKFRL